MASVRSFHRYRGATSLSLKELLAILKEQLPEIAPVQTKYRVTDVPSERTVRFYTARGLVDKPAAGPVGKPEYGYRQLLQVLAIKYLQAQYLPLLKIRSLLEGADNRELEQMIPAIAPVTARHRFVVRHDRDLPGARPPSVDARAPSASPAPPAGLPAAADAGHTDLWHRVEIGPGIELQVHAAALTEAQREQLRGALLREIGVLRGWFGGEGTT